MHAQMYDSLIGANTSKIVNNILSRNAHPSV